MPAPSLAAVTTPLRPQKVVFKTDVCPTTDASLAVPLLRTVQTLPNQIRQHAGTWNEELMPNRDAGAPSG